LGQPGGETSLPGEVVSQDSQVALGIFNHFTDLIPIQKRLSHDGWSRIFNPAQIHRVIGPHFSTYYLTGDSSNLASEEEVDEVLGFLADSDSRRILSGLHKYQQGGALETVLRSELSDKQYLGTTLPEPHKDRWITHDDNWLDVGAFTGDTLSSILTYYPSEFKSSHFNCFEPDAVSFDKLKAWCALHKPSAQLFHAAVGLVESRVAFMPSGQLSAKAEQGPSRDYGDGVEISEHEVRMLRLDDLISSSPFSHIKMDIEGAEMDAILGAQRVLQEERPKIAISLYHKPRDLFEIPIFLKNLLPNYSWFVRCYGSHGYDTILYGVPLR
jgi:FkbM family methyltransferase